MVKRLRVHVLRTAEPGGEMAEERSVFCPSTGKHEPVEACGACGKQLDLAENACALFVDCDAVDEVPRAELAKPRAVDERLDMLTVADVMTTEVVCVTERLSLNELVSLFNTHGISGAPVLEGHRVVGVVSKTDVVRAFDGQPFTVGDVMTRVALVLPACTTLDCAAAVMAYEGMHRLPVVSDGGEVVGIVTSLDVLRWIARRAGYVVPDRTAIQSS